jgi:hypothetical protein
MTAGPVSAAEAVEGAVDLPRPLDSYGDAALTSVPEILARRIAAEPMNLVASVIFLLAILHTFATGFFTELSHKRQHAHQLKVEAGDAEEGSVDVLAEVLHFLGEVEVIFGLWVVPLVISIALLYGWPSVVGYFEHGVNLTEAAFVVVIMVLASTRPILKLAEKLMVAVAGLLGGSLGALWLTLLTLGPLLGSLITEPAAMTITALLLSRRFYSLEPSDGFKYATLALMFVNVSVGGTLTHFAAPPVLMVAGPWGWDTSFMLGNIGWKAVVGILLGNALYFLWFRREFGRLQKAYALRCLKDEIEQRIVTRRLVEKEWSLAEKELKERPVLREAFEQRSRDYVARMRDKIEQDFLPRAEGQGVDPKLAKEALDKRLDEVVTARLRRSAQFLLPEEKRAEIIDPDWDDREDPVPVWVTLTHVLFMVWTIVNSHHPALFILGLLFFLGFAIVTRPYQNRVNLHSPMLVGFFLAGLVIHGGLQGWWIAPVLGSLSESSLMLAATALTAFNDNAAITYLSTLVPGFSDAMKYAVVTGAVTGGGLTIIANAPNPAGQSILKKHFGVSVSPRGILTGALAPTIIVWVCFAVL